MLSPAYDMVASSLVVEGDEEELALPEDMRIAYHDFIRKRADRIFTNSI